MSEQNYVGDNRLVHVEFKVCDVWSDFIEWLQATNPYLIDTVRVFYGPGSMITFSVTFIERGE